MLKLDRAQIFVMSYFAPTEIVADRVKTKFPFWLNRRELSVFEDLTPDARAGGFGPLYGGCLLLALAALGMSLLGRGPPLASLFPIVPVLLSVGLTQTWWARWAPQGWLLPTALLIPVLCSLAAGPAGKRWVLPFLCLLVGILNSVLILLFYSAGCVKSQWVLNAQLAFLKRLPQPLTIHMSRFRSNRVWFLRHDVSFQEVEAIFPPPRMLLKKTTTQVALPPDWRAHLPPGAPVEKWKKEKLLEE
jgi:hypothetical protein